MVLTAGAENHLVYAPLIGADDIRRIVDAVGVPVNVLAQRHWPPTGQLEALGVCRVSTGGGLARAAARSSPAPVVVRLPRSSGPQIRFIMAMMSGSGPSPSAGELLPCADGKFGGTRAFVRGASD